MHGVSISAVANTGALKDEPTSIQEMAHLKNVYLMVRLVRLLSLTVVINALLSVA